MSEYNKIQLSWFANGDQIVLRADSGDELKEVAEGVAKAMGDSLKAVNVIKQVQVASGVFTGDGAKKGGGDKTRAADTPPPTTAGSTDDTPSCKHGQMTDLRGKGYKADFYCSLKTDNWKDKCKPVKV